MKTFNYIMGCIGLGMVVGQVSSNFFVGLGALLVYLSLIWSIEHRDR